MSKHPINSNTKYRYTHDLWNRLVQVEIEKGGNWNDVSEYEYFGTHWRSVKRSDTNGNTTLDEKREMYYTAGWQLIEERIDDDYINNAGIDRNMQYLWGGRYIDDILMHREDTNGDGDFTDTADTRWWHLTDVQFSTIAILDDAANVAERVKYDSYGRALHHDWRDVDGDRDYDSSDRSIISSIAILLSNKIGDASYRAEADLNRDGIIDSNDLNLATTNYNAKLGAGVLSTDDVKNTIGWDGYVYNAEISSAGLYTVRFRWYSPDAGRWLERDPIGYVDGQNLFEICSGSPLTKIDFLGLDHDDLFDGIEGDPRKQGGYSCQEVAEWFDRLRIANAEAGNIEVAEAAAKARDNWLYQHALWEALDEVQAQLDDLEAKIAGEETLDWCHYYLLKMKHNLLFEMLLNNPATVHGNESRRQRVRAIARLLKWVIGSGYGTIPCGGINPPAGNNKRGFEKPDWVSIFEGLSSGMSIPAGLLEGASQFTNLDTMTGLIRDYMRDNNFMECKECCEDERCALLLFLWRVRKQFVNFDEETQKDRRPW